MDSEKYIGLDVHQATISVAVMDSTGRIIMESILETKAATVVEFFAGLRGTLSVTFEEGTCAAWLYDLKPHVDQLVVCKNALLKDGNKSDRIDARKLADLLRGNQLKPVYHGETGVRMLRELARSYLTIVQDRIRVMSRLKALYRSWGIGCVGRDVYYTRHRALELCSPHDSVSGIIVLASRSDANSDQLRARARASVESSAGECAIYGTYLSAEEGHRAGTGGWRSCGSSVWPARHVQCRSGHSASLQVQPRRNDTALARTLRIDEGAGEFVDPNLRRNHRTCTCWWYCDCPFLRLAGGSPRRFQAWPE